MSPNPTRIVAVATDYARRGWMVVPIPARSKGPTINGWEKLRLTPAEVPQRFRPGMNCGVILGDPSGGLVDVDLDCQEAIRLAPDFLPPGVTFGRPSKPRSHWLFTLQPAGGTRRWKDPVTGETLVELRSNGGQTVFPGSVHGSGEAISWDGGDPAGPLPECPDLADRVARLAAEVLCERYGEDMPPEVDAKVRLWTGEPPPAPPPTSSPPTGRVGGPDAFERAQLYLDRMDPSISGQNGHGALWRAALAMVKGFDLQPSDALRLLASSFNPRCKPAWSQRELEHKVDNAAKAHTEPGYLLARPLPGRPDPPPPPTGPPPSDGAGYTAPEKPPPPPFDPLEGLVARVEVNPEAAFAPDVVRALAELDDVSPRFQKLWSELETTRVRRGDLKRAMKRARAELATGASGRRRAAAMDPEDGSPEAIRSILLMTEQGKPRAAVANLIAIFAHDHRLAGRIGYHAMRETIWITEPIAWDTLDAGARPSVGEWTEQDSIRAVALASRDYGVDMGADKATQAIAVVAERQVIHPLRDYLDGLVWDGCPRLDTWASVYLGAADSEYTRGVASRWLISAVARVYAPGCKVDCVLVLEGSQGAGKSTAIRALAGDEFFAELDQDLRNKDAVQCTFGKWILELGELSALSRSEVNLVKQWLSRATDRLRLSYGKRAVDIPRCFVLAGTTNTDDYLGDDTGNRRFWPIACGYIDLPNLRKARDQLWAEAVHRFRGGATWHVDTPQLRALCEPEQEARRPKDSWLELIERWIEAWEIENTQRMAWTTVAAVLGGAIKLEPGRWDRRAEMRVASCLRALGFAKDASRRGDGRSGETRPRTWVRSNVPTGPTPLGDPNGE